MSNADINPNFIDYVIISVLSDEFSDMNIDLITSNVIKRWMRICGTHFIEVR